MRGVLASSAQMSLELPSPRRTALAPLSTGSPAPTIAPSRTGRHLHCSCSRETATPRTTSTPVERTSGGRLARTET